MLDFLAQIIPVAQDDGDGIGNLLFLVFVGIRWVVGGILKARGRKSAEEEPVKSPAKPERKAPSLLDELRKLKLELTEEATPKAIKSAAASAKRRVQRPAEKEKVVPAELVTAEPEPVVKTVLKPLELERKEKPEKPGKMRPRLPSVDYITQGDKLKAAIIYSEILGKPVALRDM